MDLWAIVVVSIFMISFISFFGSKILISLSSLFSDSFISLPLRHLAFITKNVDSIIIISVFFILGIFYVVYFDINIGKTTNSKDLAIEKHKFSFKENLENSGINRIDKIVKGTQVDSSVNDALNKLMDLDIERDLQVTQYDNICDETDIKKLKQKCSLLKKSNTCNKPKCCTWCQSKNQCVVANNNSPIFQEDIFCNV